MHKGERERQGADRPLTLEVFVYAGIPPAAASVREITDKADQCISALPQCMGRPARNAWHGIVLPGNGARKSTLRMSTPYRPATFAIILPMPGSSEG